MSERIEVNPDLPPVRLPVRVLNEMRAHALETLPEECCGLVLGSPDGFAETQRCRNDVTMLHQNDPIQYPRDGRTAFHMNEADILRIQDVADAAGMQVAAVYHSHVDAPAYFSALDQQFARQEFFPFPDAAHIVLSVFEARVRGVGLFEWTPDRKGFVGRAVETAAP